MNESIKSQKNIKNNEKKIGQPMKNLQRIRCENNEKAINQIVIKKLDKVLSKKKDLNTILNQEKLFSQETLNNFKNLKKDLGETLPMTASRKEKIVEMLKNLSEKPKNHFDFETDQKLINKNKSNFKIREKFLLDAYNEIEMEISKRKKFLSETRKYIADLASKKKDALKMYFFLRNSLKTSYLDGYHFKKIRKIRRKICKKSAISDKN